MLCRRFVGQPPAGEYQHPGMTLERSGENLGPLNSQANSIILDSRNAGLRNAGKASQLALTQFLKPVGWGEAFLAEPQQPWQNCWGSLRLPQPTGYARAHAADTLSSPLTARMQRL